MHPESIQKLIEQFLKFPTVGPRTAARFVFYLMKLPKEKIEEFIKSIQNLKNKIKFCSFCFNPFESSSDEATEGKPGTTFVREAVLDKGERNLCSICRNPTRNKELLCVVEKEIDLVSIEKTKKYKGLFFILGGTISTFKKTAFEESRFCGAGSYIEKLRIKELQNRVKTPQKFGIQTEFKEIILAFNPTLEGEATAVLVEKALKNIPGKGAVKITHLGKGLPAGGELEYADEETLRSAFEGRK